MSFEIPRVSVITVSNRPSFVCAALVLFRHMTWPHKEFVLVDSSPGGKGIDVALGSGDWMLRSPLCDEGHPEHDCAFQYEQVQPGALVPQMRNHGMGLATGDYMTWLDDDGWHSPHRVEMLMSKVDEQELDALGTQGIYWFDVVSGEGIGHYIGTRGFPMSGSMVWHRRCFEKHKFGTRKRASDHFWINAIRRDETLKHGTINRPELCVGISHGLNLSNPTMPSLCKPTNKTVDDFCGDEPYGLKAHIKRIKKAVKEM